MGFQKFIYIYVYMRSMGHSFDRLKKMLHKHSFLLLRQVFGKNIPIFLPPFLGTFFVYYSRYAALRICQIFFFFTDLQNSTYKYKVCIEIFFTFCLRDFWKVWTNVLNLFITIWRAKDFEQTFFWRFCFHLMANSMLENTLQKFEFLIFKNKRSSKQHY